ncbi:serine/threonine protein kinase [Mycobacterium sp. M1]|uniref:Serine/threonine protein kinase n=1 Tax=Mycolicibacter acidiphilus TaxID=2835306 RepID=A0ABS5RHC0_9MYCO|nr:protein kinase [Mycolicibacter acidiphilus]MBS9532973.1 serine/threonine protein kinase [Mycolicibacter acidiphilus]
MGADPLVGALLDGRYRIEAPIATGGTSTVYRGLDERLDRPIAVKVMDPRYTGDQQFLTRFQREARAVARLKDPGLVAVYDQGLGTPQGAEHPFLVMELVEGGTLRELLNERGPMPPHAVAAVLRPVLGALGVAHRAGLVHRDIKPENILISTDGEVKVADFGLVRAIAAAGITSTSVILGTAAYLSPEQVRDGDAGPPSDVYGVGVLTYELLTGRTPFTGDSTLAIAYQRLDRDVPPPSSAIDGVPREFDELVARATALDPARRYPDGIAMADAVDAITHRLGLPPFRVPAPQRFARHGAARPGRRPSPTLHLPRDPRDPAADDDLDDEYQSAAAEFAGVELSRFALERAHARRMTVIWLAVVFALTGLVAAVAWTLGNSVGALI